MVPVKEPGRALSAAALALLAVVTASPLTRPAAAQSVADFYRGKVVSIIVASGPGANHTYYSQLLAPYLRKQVPGNPDFIIKNMGGAGGMVAANYAFNRSPKDGTELALLLGDMPLASRLQSDFAKYDAKAFQYLGGAEYTRDTLAIFNSTGVKTIEEARQKEVVIGASGRGSKTYVIPALANTMLGTKFKIVTGYPGMNEVEMAMERNEVQGRLGVWASMKNIRPHWIAKDIVTHLFVADVEPEPELPGVPTLLQLMKSDEDRKIVEFLTGNGILGRAWLAPPGVPQERIDALRAAFWRALHDPEFVAAAKARSMELSQVSWQKLQAAAATIADADDETVARARDLLRQ